MFSLWVFAQRAIWFRFDSIRAFSEEKSLNPQIPVKKPITGNPRSVF